MNILEYTRTRNGCRIMARVDQDWGVGERQDENAKEEEAGGEKKERRLGGKRERSCISKVPQQRFLLFFTHK